MPLSLVTAVSAEPVSSTEAKAQCRIEVSDDDTLIGALITAARQYCEAFTHRALAPQTWDLKLDAFPCEIVVPFPPVTTITSVSYVDQNGTTQTLTATTDYLTDLPAGPMAEPGRIYTPYGTVWPVPRCITNAVTVRFTAGYTTSGVNQIPEAIKQGMKLLIGHWYENREAVVVTTAVPTVLQHAVDGLLWPYKAF